MNCRPRSVLGDSQQEDPFAFCSCALLSNQLAVSPCKLTESGPANTHSGRTTVASYECTQLHFPSPNTYSIMLAMDEIAKQSHQSNLIMIHDVIGSLHQRLKFATSGLHWRMETATWPAGEVLGDILLPLLSPLPPAKSPSSSPLLPCQVLRVYRPSL
jgi:hypothetical protein